MKVIRSNEEFIRPVGIPSIFLVGPSPRSASVQSWRPEALDILTDLQFNGYVYVPEPFCNNYQQQIHWETLGLSYVDVIAAWVPRSLPDMLGLTTNIEFGEWLHKDKLVYGRPDGAPHTAYLDERYKYRDLSITGIGDMKTSSPFGNVPHNNLRSLLIAATRYTG